MPKTWMHGPLGLTWASMTIEDVSRAQRDSGVGSVWRL